MREKILNVIFFPVHGCYFHYCQAIIQKIKSLGMIKLFKKFESFASWVRKLMAVPLLPSHLIQQAYEELLGQRFVFGRNHQHFYNKLNKFKRYMRSTWMTQDVRNLSVFGLENRTNNVCESYHRQFNRLVGDKHPGAYDFANFVNQMLFNAHADFMRLQTNPEVPVVRGRRPGLEHRMAISRQNERLLTTGQITPMDFISRNSHSADGLIARAIETRRERNLRIRQNQREIDAIEADTSDEDPDENEIIEDEVAVHPNVNVHNQGPQDVCLSCHQPAIDKFILTCGQQPFCNTCTENILAVDHAICPVCNLHVTGSIRILQNLQN